jgi:heptosyltransferase II
MTNEPRNILIVQPSWVGDAVMATPTLRAIRNRFPKSRITYLMKRYVKPIYAGMPWADRLLTYRTGKTDKRAGRSGTIGMSRLLRQGAFDLAVLLPNSFRMALICKMAGVKRIVGYDRDGRGLILTDKLVPLRAAGAYVPTPIVSYYLALARYLGAGDRDLTMQLFVTDAERHEARDVMLRAGLDADLDRPWQKTSKPLIVLNPGAQYGAAKCWLPEYFAALSDRLVDELGATVLVSTAPRERKIVDDIARHSKRPFIDLARSGPTLGSLKEIVRRCDLMITNDTGPRHIAAAMRVPVVTIFGPTHPEWTEIEFEHERKVSVPVFCGPCQKKICPLDHRCMTQVTPDMVFTHAAGLLGLNVVRSLPVLG